MLEELCYEIHLEKYSVDSDFDLLATKNGEKIAILIRKTLRNTKVSNSVIIESQEATGAYWCTGSIVITTSCFT